MKKSPTQTGVSLVDVLLREGLITQSQLNEAMRIQEATDKPLARILVELGAITESAKMSILKKTFGYELVSLVMEEIDPKILTLIPRSIAYRHHVVPIRIEDKTLVLAMEDPSNLVLIDNLKALVGMNIRPVIVSASDIDEALKLFPTVEVERKIRVPFLSKLLRALFLPIVALAPLPIFILVLRMSESLQTKLAPLTPFDFVLYFILGLGLWALIAWEINGIIFKSKKE
ncbi:hypothetical protein J7M23_05215, partial [Candidatus Sumerlaeota bacterium]|nr:hypothetical protein [Candidatus Sumerlaeota bacterium]